MKYLLVFLAITLSSCSSLDNILKEEQNSDSYSKTETGKLSSIAEGVVLSIKKVKLSGSKGLGTGLGAVIGGLAGSATTDKKYNKDMATALGVLVGSVIAGKTEEAITSDYGYEFIIDTKDGAKVLIEKARGELEVGDEIYIIYGDKVRLTKRKI
jgi:outer membrane lipoprotein SlyB